MGSAKTTILFIEDNEIVRKSLTRDLLTDHFAVTAVAGGKEGINALDKGPFDLVITDLMMPDVDGFKVLKTVKKTTPLTRVIILTGYGDTQSAIDALRLGADDFIHKPCEVEELVFRIHNCLTKNNLLLEHKRAEEKQASLKAQLIHSQKMKAIGLLAGGIAHDFNNLLSLILGHSEIARHAVAPESEVAKKLDKVIEAGHRSVSLAKQVHAFGHLDDNNRMALNPVYIVKEVIKSLRQTLPSTIAVKQQIKTGNTQILADPTQIYQIFMNICTNALQAMERTGGTLKISLKDRELSPEDLLHQSEVEPGNFVVLSVGDTGPGIAAEISGKILAPHCTTEEIDKNTSTGLPIVHQIIKTYCGYITCESTPGEGTYFHVFFPALQQKFTPVIENILDLPHPNQSTSPPKKDA